MASLYINNNQLFSIKLRTLRKKVIAKSKPDYELNSLQCVKKPRKHKMERYIYH